MLGLVVTLLGVWQPVNAMVRPKPQPRTVLRIVRDSESDVRVVCRVMQRLVFRVASVVCTVWDACCNLWGLQPVLAFRRDVATGMAVAAVFVYC